MPALLESFRARKLIIPMLVIFIALLVQTSWAEEDAFITLRTSDNFIHGYGLRWNVDERVQTFTNPLWMFLLAGVHSLIQNPYLTLILLSLVVSALAMLVLLVYGSQDNFGLLLGFSILILSKAFVDFSTSGLENPASHLLAAAFAVTYFKAEKPFSEKNLFFLSLLAGLAAFNRMDTLLFYLPALGAALYGRVSWRSLLIIMAGLLPLILWEIFSVIYYGSPLPNTYYAKISLGIPLSGRIAQGALYFVNSLGWDPITLVTIFSALVLAFVNKRREEILLAAGIVLYLGYIIWIGGDFMSGRFFSVPLILSVALLIRHVREAATLERWIWISLVLLLGLLLAPLKSFANPLESDLQTFDTTTGIADERAGYYRYTNLLLFSRQADPPAYPFVDYGLNLQKQGMKVAAVTGVGMVGYFAGPDVHLIDTLGLGDPLLARLPPDDLSNWNIAHFKRSIPAGYFETVQSGENRIKNPHLAEYYDHLHLIVSGNLWSAERWVAIWKMNTGGYDDLIDAYLQSNPR